MEISIIVAVYNTSHYLKRCVDSIISQTFKDWELILIDDGSTDESGELCDNYASADSRITVIHKQNGGIASVRQLGIIRAEGKYSIHIDSDDWIEPTMLEEMYSQAESTHADIIVTDYYHEYSDKQVYSKQQAEENPIKAIGAILSHVQTGVLWNKLIRHSLYKKYNLYFFENINIGEDALLLVRLYQQDVKIRHINKAYYHYMNNGDNNSITRKRNLRLYKSSLTQLNKLTEVIPQQYVSMVKRQIRQNDILALNEGIVGVSELRKRGVSFKLSDLLIRDIGQCARIVTLLYILHLDKVCVNYISRVSN